MTTFPIEHSKTLLRSENMSVPLRSLIPHCERTQNDLEVYAPLNPNKRTMNISRTEMHFPPINAANIFHPCSSFSLSPTPRAALPHTRKTRDERANLRVRKVGCVSILLSLEILFCRIFNHKELSFVFCKSKWLISILGF